jgi:hypothetical protein
MNPISRSLALLLFCPRLYRDFALLNYVPKSNQKKSRLYSNPTNLVSFPAGSRPKLAPPTSGLKQGRSLPPSMAQIRDLNKAEPDSI